MLGLALLLAAGFDFRPQEIQSNWSVVYAVSFADMNGDKRPDIVAINPTQVAWFENPSWTKHVVLDGGTKKDNVCVTAEDIDRDGKLDLAVGADWQPTNTQSGGSLQWLRQGSPPPWRLTPIAEEPTLHRIAWGDVDGDGKRELIVVPLHGRGTKGPEWQGAGARILVFRVPKVPEKETWPVEVADNSLHIVHNFTIVGDEIWTASVEGIHGIRRGKDGTWSKRKLVGGAPGEIKVGRVNGARHVATVEPWHGNSIVAYDAQWNRTVIEDKLNQAHALGWGDFDGDGSDDLAAGWRGKPFGLAVYKRAANGEWSKTAIDDALAAEDLAVGDLNADGRPEIVAGGRATQNIRIYWNNTARTR
jgi:hypothetical protein